jgi:hypothetical protein
LVLEKNGEDKLDRLFEKLRSVTKNIVQTIKRRAANWIGQILLGNCHLKHDIEGSVEGRIEVTERRGRRRKEP